MKRLEVADVFDTVSDVCIVGRRFAEDLFMGVFAAV